SPAATCPKAAWTRSIRLKINPARLHHYRGHDLKEIADLAKRAYQAPDGSDDREQFLSAMNKAEQKRSALFEALILLASPAATDAATAVNPVVWRVLGAARRKESDPREISLVEELNNYHRQARLDLGISIDHQVP
ncbi:hypothetical protein ABZX41_45685, partial [Streptomyces sp. NPDC004533]